MSKEYIGRAMAFLGKPPGAKKNQYCNIGAVFKDIETDNISLKIDAIPLPNSGWTGWVNVWSNEDSFAPPPKKKEAAKDDGTLNDLEDDIPF